MGKRILYVWKGIYPWEVRIEKICYSLINHGFEVFLLARWEQGQSKQEIINGIKVIRVGFNKSNKLTLPLSFNPIWRKSIKKVIREIKPDIIIPKDIMLAHACRKFGKKFKIPVVMDMTENYPVAMKAWKKYKRSFFSRLLVHKLNIPEYIEKRAVGVMDGIITVCEEQNERLVTDFGFNQERIQVVQNTPWLTYRDRVLKSGSPKTTSFERIIFGHHGYITADKSIEKFLRGFLLAAEIDRNIEFIIAGDGECFDDLKQITDNSKVGDRVHFTGKYADELFPEIIGKINIGVLPYQISGQNNYTIHNKLFDFFALEKPVFVSMTKPFSRVVNETGTGIIVDCEDVYSIKEAILSIREKPLEEYAKNCLKAYKEKYNWDFDSLKLINFINKFI